MYVGLAGIALTYFRLYECYRRMKSIESATAVGWSGEDPSQQAQLYLKSAITVINAAGSSQVCIGMFSLIISTSWAMGCFDMRVALLN